jgi:hypothetical protein
MRTPLNWSKDYIFLLKHQNLWITMKQFNTLVGFRLCNKSTTPLLKMELEISTWRKNSYHNKMVVQNKTINGQEKLKAWLVVPTTKEMDRFWGDFGPIIKWVTIKVAIHGRWKMCHLDVKKTFLKGTYWKMCM